MKYRVGFGAYGVFDPKTIETALSVGYRVIDSARLYRNEAVCAQGIANFLKNNPSIKREEIIYTTKVWPTDFGYDKTMKAVQESYGLVKDAIGVIDLYLVHTPQASTKIRLETYQALQDCVAKGLIKEIGVSNYGVAHLKELLEWDGLKVHPTYNQIELNPWLQHEDITEYCAKHNIIVQAYTPLMSGAKNNDPVVQSLARKYNKRPAQIFLRWNVQKGFMPLPKSAKIERMKQNLDVFDFTLSTEEIDALGNKSDATMAYEGFDRTTY